MQLVRGNVKHEPGYVYILSNKSMPGILKIGRSVHGGKKRAKEIYRGATGVASEFVLEYEVYVNNCFHTEIDTHLDLDDFRENDSREFFRCSIRKAIEVINNRIILQFEPNDHELKLGLHDDDLRTLRHSADRLCQYFDANEFLRAKIKSSFFELFEKNKLSAREITGAVNYVVEVNIASPDWEPESYSEEFIIKYAEKETERVNEFQRRSGVLG